MSDAADASADAVEEPEDWLRALADALETPPSIDEPAAFALIGIDVGDVLNHRYRIVDRIGAGAMGAVFAAEQEALERRVAVKVMRAEVSTDRRFRARFHREALAAARVKHPNVVDVLDFGIHHDRPFLVMELLEGETLRSRLARTDQLDVPELAALMVPTLSAVNAAHDSGVVHRDLKPDNILLAQVGSRIVPKVLDFGIAKIGDHGRLTGTGGAIGTPAYMAPEQMSGTAEPDATVDQYAAATILFEALAGKLPFGSDGHPPLSAKTSVDAPSLAALRPDLPRGLCRAIQRALARDRHKRHGGIDLLIRALENPEAGVERRGAWFVAGAAILVALGIATAVVWGQQDEIREASPEVRREAEPPQPSHPPRTQTQRHAEPTVSTPASNHRMEPEPTASAPPRAVDRTTPAQRPSKRTSPVRAQTVAPTQPVPDVSERLGANDAPILQ